MNRKDVEVMSRVAGIIAQVKVQFPQARELLNDCQEIMASHCDTAPINLIAGNLDKIVQNLENHLTVD